MLMFLGRISTEQMLSRQKSYCQSYKTGQATIIIFFNCKDIIYSTLCLCFLFYLLQINITSFCNTSWNDASLWTETETETIFSSDFSKNSLPYPIKKTGTNNRIRIGYASGKRIHSFFISMFSIFYRIRIGFGSHTHRVRGNTTLVSVFSTISKACNQTSNVSTLSLNFHLF